MVQHGHCDSANLATETSNQGDQGCLAMGDGFPEDTLFKLNRTVPTVRLSLVAITPVLAPSAISAAISLSRGVSRKMSSSAVLSMSGRMSGSLTKLKRSERPIPARALGAARPTSRSAREAAAEQGEEDKAAYPLSSWKPLPQR